MSNKKNYLKLFSFVFHIALSIGLIVAISTRGLVNNHPETIDVGIQNVSYIFSTVGTVNLFLLNDVYLFVYIFIAMLQLCHYPVHVYIEWMLLLPFEWFILSLLCDNRDLFPTIAYSLFGMAIPLLYYIQEKIDLRENQVLLIKIKYPDIRIPVAIDSMDEGAIAYPYWNKYFRPEVLSVLFSVFAIIYFCYYCSMSVRSVIVYFIIVSEVIYIITMFFIRYIKYMDIVAEIYGLFNRMLITGAIYSILITNSPI